MKKTFNIKVSSILLWIVTFLVPVQFVFLCLNLFDVLKISSLSRPTFNYIVAFLLLIICLALFIALLVFEKRKNLIIPEWFRCILSVGIFVFINSYYFFGLYLNIVGLIFLYIFIGLILNILALAIFYNTQKNQDNSLKETAKFTCITTASYALSIGFIFEIIVASIKVLVIKSSFFASLSMCIIELCLIVFVTIVMSASFYISLSKQKRFVNSCLIRYYKTNQ